MNLSCAHRQLDAPVLLSLLTSIDRTWARIRYFRFGSYSLPGVNDRQTLDNTGGDNPHGFASARPVDALSHTQTSTAEAPR